MKNTIKKFSLRTLSLAIIAIALIAVVTSCSKKSDTKTSFSGTYYGTLVTSIYSEADTIIIPASSSSAVVMNNRTGRGSSYSINGTVSGTTISIPSQSVFVLGATYGASGSGTLNNSTLVIHYAFVSSSDVTTNFTFTGTRR